MSILSFQEIRYGSKNTCLVWIYSMDCRYVRLLRVENPSAVHGRTNMLNAGRLLMCLAPLYISLGGELVWAICTACTCNIQQQDGIHIACDSWICIQDDRMARKLYLLTHSRSRVLLEKLTGSQLVKKFPAFYGTRKFITTFTSARRLSLSWVR